MKTNKREKDVHLMEKKVFISHSSQDIAFTERLVNFIEDLGQPCWYSERDLDKRTNRWADELMLSIEMCSAVVLLVTKNAVVSNEVENEIVNASAKNKQIIIFLLENVSLPPRWEFYVKKHQWIHAYNMTEDEALGILADKLSIVYRTNTVVTEVSTNSVLLQEHACFRDIKTGGFGIGYDKCLMSNGTGGWAPKQVYIEEVDTNAFSFDAIGEHQLEQAYQAFCNSDEYARMNRRGNNHDRWMITDLYQNENVYISIQKTNWSQTSFWWNRVKDNLPMQQQMATHAFCTQVPFYPNSFCLHLIVETADEKLVCTKVSNNKKNDYAYTIAATIGEQLEQTDFSSGDMNNNVFVYAWCKRAFLEEFYFKNENYHSYVDESSIRVLGITYEGDIYNFALPVYIKLKITYDSLLSYMASSAKNTEEFSDILYYTKEEILEILRSANTPEAKDRFHPSTFLRFLLYINYKAPDALTAP